MLLFFNSVGQYSSSLYETARNLLRSRNNQAKRAQEQAERSREVNLLNEQLVKELRNAKKQHAQILQQLRQQEQENEVLRKQPVTLPSDLPLPA